MEQVKSWVLSAGAVVLALLILATLVRAVLGPRFTDRIVAVNVISTLVIAELMLLSVWLREDFLVDIALVFALLSFLAVVVASRLVIIRQRKRREDQRKKGRENGHDT
ncbi:MAG TPA: sodium:proton antiporter [Candidatus Oscillibacter excrementigallinarum]|uniref:Sodium:proton antiporter n=1 Tax=Candidatus Oscillibacter excrementigallinarum TaxID=2838716 RepID=A0A9D2LJE2_9FIRM|nr:monovalent cation/H+ antiporter complex subunit F [uncultured Oscillibacter sp.]HJB13828.1 sodium:proton antiporter [Candidatus Oscillibacter excrementigallinarum]